MSLIENLRGKSENYKRGVAFGVSLFVTLAIFGVWVTVLFPGTISNRTIVAQRAKPEQPVATFSRNVASALSAVKFQFASVFHYFKDMKVDTNNEIIIVSPEESEARARESQQTTKTDYPATNKGSSVVY